MPLDMNYWYDEGGAARETNGPCGAIGILWDLSPSDFVRTFDHLCGTERGLYVHTCPLLWLKGVSSAEMLKLWKKMGVTAGPGPWLCGLFDRQHGQDMPWHICKTMWQSCGLHVTLCLYCMCVWVYVQVTERRDCVKALYKILQRADDGMHCGLIVCLSAAKGKT